MKITKTGGCISLLCATILWATGYIVTKDMVEDVPPDFLLSVRYVIAAGLTALLCIPRRKQMSKGLLAAGIWMGIALFAEFYCFTLGVKYTTASKSSFIIASYIIMLPFVYLVIRKKRPSRIDIIGSVICMAGLLIIFAENLGDFNFGDLICLGSALGYAVHIVFSAQYVRQYDGMLLNLVQLVTMAVISTVLTLFTGGYRAGFAAISVPELLYLSTVCTIVPYFLCLMGMRVVSTTTSGIILSSECVFATILAVIFLQEQLSWQLVVGGCVIFLSFVLTELMKNESRGQVSHGDSPSDSF